MKIKQEKYNIVTSYDLDNGILTYDDGFSKWTAKFYFNIPKKEFKLYNISKCILTDDDIAVTLMEFLTFHYYISLEYLPSNMYAEYFSFTVNGYNVSKSGYDLITYYITELPSIPSMEDNKTLKPLRNVFSYIINNMEKLGKEDMLFKYKGSRRFFDIFIRDLMHIIENYENFPDNTSILFDYKKCFRNHEFYILPNNEDTKSEEESTMN